MKNAIVKNLCGANKNIHWRNKAYGEPHISVFVDEYFSVENNCWEKVYYYAICRHASDGSVHKCIDMSLPMSEEEYLSHGETVEDNDDNNRINFN